MAVSTRSLREALVAVAGAGAVREGDGAETVDGVVPGFTVAPGTVDELAALVALAHEEKLAVVPRGAGTAMALGHPLVRADLVVDLRRLDGVLEYNPDDLTVTVAAGATMGALTARLRPRGQFLPLDPPGATTRTMGGVIATGASGPLRARYGTARDLLLGVRFVQADGAVTWGGAKVVKSVTGYDVPKLMVGALGTLGVLAELTLRLHPAPEVERTSLIVLPGADAGQALVASLIDSPLQPNRVEWLNGAAARAWGEASALVAVAVSVGGVEAAVDAQHARIDTLARRIGGSPREVPHEGWRHHGLPADAGITLRVGTLPDRLAHTVTGIERAAGELGPSATVAITGSAMLGALRVELTGASPRQGAAVVARLRTLVEPLSGSVVVERAPLELRRAVDPWGPVPAEALALMRAIKQQFDPERILNPGRFVGGL